MPGIIYLQEPLILEGNELIDEIRIKLNAVIETLIFKFIEEYDSLQPKEQEGDPTYYPRRTPQDSQLDINKTIEQQFNLMRTVDNEKYPAFFIYDGYKYYLKIYKAEKQD